MNEQSKDELIENFEELVRLLSIWIDWMEGRSRYPDKYPVESLESLVREVNSLNYAIQLIKLRGE